MKNKLEKILALILTVAICCTMPTPFYASTNTSSEDSNTITITSDMMTETDIALCDAMISGELEDGDIIVLEESPFESLYITIEDSDESMSRSTNMTTIKTMTFTRKILGIEQKLFKITLTCNWIKNGTSSKITKLGGLYETLASGVTCSWDKNYSKYAPMICNLGLDFSYDFGLKSGFMILYSKINADYNSLSIGYY